MSHRLPHLKGKGIVQQMQEQANASTQQNFPPEQPPDQFNQQKQQQIQSQGQQQAQQQPYQQTQANQQPPQPPQNPQTQQNYQQQKTEQQQTEKSQSKSKINLDLIPRPFQTTEESINYKIHQSNQQQISAPYSYSYFIQKDEGCAGPRFVRPSIYSLASEPSLIKQAQVPQGCIITPFAELNLYEEPVAVIDSSTQPMIRCSRCLAYINPFFIFNDAGNSFVCNLCKQSNKVPNEYYSPLNDNQERTDKYIRPELSKGVYDFIAPDNYPRKEFKQNYIMICLEFTNPSIQSGLFLQILNTLKISLDSIPYPERTSIALCTYNKQINFYSIPKDLSNDPQLIVVPDLEDPYCPFPKNALFLNILDDREKLDYLIDKLQQNSENANLSSQNQFLKTASVASLVTSIHQMLEETPAKIIVFNSQLSQLGFGKLKRRDEVKIMGTEQEKTLYTPQCPSYKELASTLLKKSICVDLFLFSPDYCDITTISQLSTYTGGSIYYYPYYNSKYDGEKIHYELFRNLTRNYAVDCIMTLRSSPGVILEDYYTSRGKVSVRDLQISYMDPDQSIAVQYKQEDKINTEYGYIQFAILYTNLEGKRMIRIFNMAFQVQNNIQGIFKSIDFEGTIGLLFRRALSNMTNQTTKQIFDQLIAQSVNILYSYRNNCASGSSSGQLILPESIKYLPVILQALFKQELFRSTSGGKPDAKAFEMIKTFSLTPYQFSLWLYPKIYAVHNIQNESFNGNLALGSLTSDEKVVMPQTLPASFDRLIYNGIYLIDNGERIYVWVQKDTDLELIQQIFGVQEYQQLKEIDQFPYIAENEVSVKINQVINQLRRNKNGTFQSVQIVSYKDQEEQILKNLMVEDEVRGQQTYADFLCQMHNLIQSKYVS